MITMYMYNTLFLVVAAELIHGIIKKERKQVVKNILKNETSVGLTKVEKSRETR